MIAEKPYVFVYGSLKRGFTNHHFLQQQIYLGNYHTKLAIYQMYDIGPYPAVKESGQFYISGELYQVDSECLQNLDKLEDNGNTYQRKLVEIQNHHAAAWMYFYLKEIKTEIKPTNFTVRKLLLNNIQADVYSWEQA